MARRRVRRRRRGKPNVNWLNTTLVQPGNAPSLGGLTSGTSFPAAQATSLLAAALERDSVIAGGFLQGTVEVEGTSGATPADRGLVLTLCVGLGLMENQASASGQFVNDGLASGGPQDAVALQQNRYYLLCCVDLPLGQMRRAANGEFASSAQGHGDHWQRIDWVRSDGTVSAGWNFHCRVKSRRKVEGQSPTLPVIALSATVNEAAAIQDETFAVTMRNMDYRTTVWHPRGA